jgi:hypothetical protein
METAVAVKVEEKSLLTRMREPGFLPDPKEWLFADAAVDQMCWFRDNISSLLRHQINETYDCWIAGWHRSKSITLPVYCWRRDDLTVIARHNFYNINCTILSDRDIEIPDYMQIDVSENYLFLEGMAEHKRPPYRDSRREFSFCKWDRQQFYAVMWCIASQSKR